MKRPPWFRKKSEVEANKDFVGVKISFPKEQYEFLCQKSAETMLPLSRLVAYAVDNERDSTTPFHYPCIDPQTVYVPHAYTEEAQKIHQFLTRFGGGLSRDNLVLFRRALGIANKSVILLAIRELLITKMVIETSMKPPGQAFEFAVDMRWIRVSTHLTEDVEKKRAILEKKKAALAREEEQLQIKEFLNARPKLTKAQLLEQDRKEFFGAKKQSRPTGEKPPNSAAPGKPKPD